MGPAGPAGPAGQVEDEAATRKIFWVLVGG